MEAKRNRSYGELFQKFLRKDPIREEYRYIRFLLFKKVKIFFPDTNDSAMYIRQNITKLITPGDPEIIQYIISAGRPDELILNTKEEYLEYLATGPVLQKKR